MWKHYIIDLIDSLLFVLRNSTSRHIQRVYLLPRHLSQSLSNHHLLLRRHIGHHLRLLLLLSSLCAIHELVGQALLVERSSWRSWLIWAAAERFMDGWGILDLSKSLCVDGFARIFLLYDA